VAASGGPKEQPLPDPPVPRSVALGQRVQSKSQWRAFVLVVLLLVTSVTTSWKLGPSAFHRIMAGFTAHLWPKTPPASAQSTIAPTTATDAATAPPPPPVQPVEQAEIPHPSKLGPPPQQTKTGFAEGPGSGAESAVEKKPAKAKPVTVAAKLSATTLPKSLDVPAVADAEGTASSLEVQVRVTQDAWVQIVVDGKLLSAGVLAAPAEKRVRAAREVVLKTENAAGVEVSLNGKPLGPLGEEHEITTVTLTAAGIQH
jgi:Domain of unknown function (DUF4115)